MDTLATLTNPALLFVTFSLFFILGRMEAAAAARLAKQGLAMPVDVVGEAMKQARDYDEAMKHTGTLGVIRWMLSLHRAPEAKPPRDLAKR